MKNIDVFTDEEKTFFKVIINNKHAFRFHADFENENYDIYLHLSNIYLPPAETKLEQISIHEFENWYKENVNKKNNFFNDFVLLFNKLENIFNNNNNSISNTILNNNQ